MPKLGEPNFDCITPSCDAEYRRWTRQTTFNFSGNQNKKKTIKHLSYGHG